MREGTEEWGLFPQCNSATQRILPSLAELSRPSLSFSLSLCHCQWTLPLSHHQTLLHRSTSGVVVCISTISIHRTRASATRTVISRHTTDTPGALLRSAFQSCCVAGFLLSHRLTLLCGDTSNGSLFHTHPPPFPWNNVQLSPASHSITYAVLLVAGCISFC